MKTLDNTPGADCKYLIDPSDPDVEEKRRLSGILALVAEVEGDNNSERVEYLKQYIALHSDRTKDSPPTTYPEDSSFPEFPHGDC